MMRVPIKPEGNEPVFAVLFVTAGIAAFEFLAGRYGVDSRPMGEWRHHNQ